MALTGRWTPTSPTFGASWRQNPRSPVTFTQSMALGTGSAMHSWFFSLQFRLILGFTLVLALALGSISWYVGFAAQREAERFQQEVEEARSARLEALVSRAYSARRWTDLQPTVEQAGALYGWRVVVTDQAGQVVGDSHMRFGRPPRPGSRFFPVLSGGSQVGSVAIAPSDAPEIAPEPPFSRLVTAVQRSLLWTGLAAGAGGILLISLISRRILAPVRLLSSAAHGLGQGDLTRRVTAPGRNEVGQLAGTFNIMADSLQQAEQQRRNLVADVAHELRTPLSNIQGYLEAVKDGLLQPDSATIETVYQQVLHLSHLVEDLRLLALTEAGTLHLNSEPDSLEDALRRSVDAVRPRAEARGIAVSLNVPPEFPMVEIDRTRITQVIGNLLENAIQHTPESGEVTVLAQVIGLVAKVTVADTGEGIPPEDLPYVFERFYRVDASRSRATGGVGLGLTIARKLVEAHRGAIRVESTPGKGSRFIFELPLARTPATKN
ncbi:MAG: HAMP domain-containing protein [Dehalococcoidia bacterium]|nr:HAMP domain-containing protein [Dehalococcoidia bacterium]